MKIITAADSKYEPGVLALNNSVLDNCPNDQLICFVDDPDYGSYLKEDHHIETKLVTEKDFPVALPTSALWAESSPLMYARLLIPYLYDDMFTAWIDADAVVVNKIEAWPMFPHACAAVKSWDYSIESQVGNLPFIMLNKQPALQAGVMLINKYTWTGLKVTERCFKIMRMDTLHFKYVVQSVLSLALEGHFFQLPHAWNVFVPVDKIPEDIKVAHYAGAENLPWQNSEVTNRHYWEKYSDST